MIDYFPLLGGLDQSSAPLAIQPGRLLNCVNFEIAKSGKGYRYPNGYERYDGQVAPSSSTYTLIDFSDGREEITAGTTVTTNAGGSGATGVCIVTAVVESGSYAADDASGYVVILATSGTFLTTDSIKVGVDIYITTIDTVHVAGSGAPDTTTDATWVALAKAEARSNITTVPGSGDIIGVHRYNSTLYAFRDNAGGTATDMYKSSATGWTQVSLGNQLDFTLGTSAYAVGDTVSQGGVSATVQLVVVTSGSWTGNDAAGFLIVGTVTGGNFAAGAIAGDGGATASGAQTANTLTKSGRYECINHNFGGHAGSSVMYGVNGVNKAFYYDGTAFAFITTGMTTDKPIHIAAHQGHLFLMFSGGSVQHSSLVSSPLTAPFVWSAVLGAAEFGIGDEGTGFENTAGETLTIFSKNKTKILYGDSAANWNLQDHSNSAGAVEWTIQSLNEPFYVDSDKITSLRATQAYGGFSIAGLSDDIQNFMISKSGLEIASVVSLEKSQYRVLYSDGYFVSMSLRPEGIAGFMIGEYDDSPTCATYDRDTGEMFFGCDDGFVYEMDKGTSFDGGDITAFLKIPFNFFKSPNAFKRFYKIIYELSNEDSDSIAFSFVPDYDYMNANIPTAQTSSISVSAGNMTWDVDNWDTYNWSSDSDSVEQPEAYINGMASEMGLLIYHKSSTQTPFTINGVMIEYSMQGNKR